MKYIALYNPLAGNANGYSDVLDSLTWLYKDKLTVYNITEIADYNELFSTLSVDDAVIICGGDGTLNRFINDTEGVQINCDVLYFPSGTGNDFLHDLGKQSGDAPFSIKEYITDLPTVEVNGKTYRFLNNVGFGIDGYCCEVGDEQKKTSTKSVNYTAIAIKGLLFDYKPCGATITVDGTEYRYKKVWLAPTMKGRFYGGGMMAAPNQDRCNPDSTLSVMLFHGAGSLRTLIAFPSIFKGEHIKHTKMVSIHTGSDISVKFDSPRAVQIDGETIVGVTEYRATSKILAKTDI